jgi:DNA modification methylase
MDPFMGSGSTAAAAKKLGRQWFGCELSPEYVKQATAYLRTVKHDSNGDQ